MQNKVKIFNDNMNCHREPMSVSARLLDCISELGELAKECLKATNYGTQDFAVTRDFELEYGDVLYCLLSLANEVGISADKCIDMVIKKYQERIDLKQTMGSEDNND